MPTDYWIESSSYLGGPTDYIVYMNEKVKLTIDSESEVFNFVRS